MFTKRTLPIIIAIPTALAMMGMAWYQRHVGHIDIPTVAYYIAAAVITVAPVAVAMLRGKACRC